MILNVMYKTFHLSTNHLYTGKDSKLESNLNHIHTVKYLMVILGE